MVSVTTIAPVNISLTPTKFNSPSLTTADSPVARLPTNTIGTSTPVHSSSPLAVNSSMATVAVSPMMLNKTVAEKGSNITYVDSSSPQAKSESISRALFTSFKTVSEPSGTQPNHATITNETTIFSTKIQFSESSTKARMANDLSAPTLLSAGGRMFVNKQLMCIIVYIWASFSAWEGV
jgi:hypothetical protein